MFDLVSLRNCTPLKYFYGTIENPNSDEPNVGMFLESDNSKYHFLAYLEGDELKMDYWVDSNYTPLNQHWRLT